MTDYAFFLIVTLDLNKAKRWAFQIPKECNTLKQKACYDVCYARNYGENLFCKNQCSCVKKDNINGMVNCVDI